MHELKKPLAELQVKIAQALETLKISELEARLTEMDAQMAQPDFWNDTAKAQEVSKQRGKLQQQIEPWRTLEKEVSDIAELAEMGDESMQGELAEQLAAAQTRFEAMKKLLQFNGKYDDHDVILRLSAGAGGTDAQDWAEMLERMYLRWAEKTGMKAAVVERSTGDEAGIKSSVIEMSGPYAYGKLHGEHGVHRLVRLSPFNSDNLRQTSFALVEILPQIDAPDEVQIDDKDLKTDVYRAGGHGGQSVNTTDSAVRITHLPTNIVVAIQNERSQIQNKETAMKVLRSKLAQLQVEQHAETLEKVKGPTKSAEWGAQIRNYVLHPYTMVKDTRTKYEDRDASGVLDGKIDGFIDAYLDISLTK